MRHLTRKLAYHYGNGGISGLLGKAGEVLRQACWSEIRWLLYRHDLAGALPEVDELTVRRELGLQELIAMGYFKARAFPEEISRRFTQNNVCHGFFRGEYLVTVGWSSPSYLELDQSLRIPCSGGVGLFDFLTLEQFRSRGFYGDALMQLVREVRQAGFASAYIAVDPRNAPSIRAIERAGFRQIHCVTRRRRFGLAVVTQRAAMREGWNK